MPHPDALIWDDRYSNDVRWRDLNSPRPLLVLHLDLLPRGGRVLDVACGTTPTGLHRARQGWQVIALDVSTVALRIAHSKVREEGLPVSFAVMDLLNPWLMPEHFDVILNFYYLSRPLWETYREALKPGGLLFFETFVRDDPFSVETDGNPLYYLEPEELRSTFKGWQIIHYEETHRVSRSMHQQNKPRRIAQLVARKPE